MQTNRIGRWFVAMALAAAACGWAGAWAAIAQERDVYVEAGVEVLTRGPVHEAFAETVTFDLDVGLVVTKSPPEFIEELPPDQRPDGSNVEWIPGYWAWDDERGDYLWVSGVWRALPPGRAWAPGYWARTAGGFQWIAGYWADAQVSEIAYLPEPPATIEVGPTIVRPSAEHVWIPGVWVWQRARYAWRPGYWLIARPDWDWVPPHYVWAPRGYVFVDGYWDHCVARRGVLFAPVYFDARVYPRRIVRYSPTTVIDVGVFSDHLFVRPHYRHYYFGDYYAPHYHEVGFYASFSFGSTRRGYDPIYAHVRWQHRDDPDWRRRVEADFQYRRDHEDARPPRTLAAQRSAGPSEGRPEYRRPVVAKPLQELTQSKDSPWRFRTVDANARQTFGQREREVRQYREERQKLDTARTEAPVARSPRAPEPAKVKAPSSPITTRRIERSGKDQVAPRKPEQPKPDPNAQPKPKRPTPKKEGR